jgi:hypothetical protein
MNINGVSISKVLPYFEKKKINKAYEITLRCVCLCVPLLLSGNGPLLVVVIKYHYLSMSLCPPILSFIMRSVSYHRNVRDYFISSFIVFYHLTQVSKPASPLHVSKLTFHATSHVSYMPSSSHPP